MKKLFNIIHNKKNSIVFHLIVFLFSSSFFNAQTDIASWSLTTNGNNSYSHSSVNATGIHTAQNNISYGSQGMNTTSWNNSNIEHYRYFGISIASSNGNAVNISSLKFEQVTFGPQNYTIRYYISPDGSLPTDDGYDFFYNKSSILINNESISANPVKNIPLNITLTGTQKLIVRFYTWGSGWESVWRIKENTLKFTSNLTLPPVAVNDNFEIYQNTTTPLDILQNDILNGSLSAINITQQPEHGDVIVNETQNIIYIPSDNYTGRDSFRYTLTNQHGVSNTALVDLDVIIPTEAPLVSWEGVRLNWSNPTPNPSYYNNSGDKITGSNITGNNVSFTINYNGFEGNSWPTGSSPDYTKYFQISLQPKTGQLIDLKKLIFSQSGYCNAFEVRYSTNINFPSNGTLLLRVDNNATSIPTHTIPLNFSITDSQTIYVRFYGFKRDANNTPWRLNNSPYNLQSENSSLKGPAFYGVIKPAQTSDIVIWNGTSWSNGTGPNINIKSYINGSYPNNIVGAGSFTTKKLTVSNTGALNVLADKAITVENGIVNNGTITVESDGNLIQTNDAATNTGNITVKRIAKMKRQDYTYWSSPVSGQNLKSFSEKTLDNRFYTYNEADNGFVGINPVTNFFGNNSSGDFESAAKGYAIRAYNTYPTNGTVQTFTGTFTGVPNNGSKTFTLKKEGDGYNLVGNPYPSNIDFDELYNNNSSVISNAAYFWTNTNVYSEGDYIANNYAQYVNGEGNPAANLEPNKENTPTNIIKPGQGFLVESLGNGTLNFSNSIRTSDTEGVFFNSKSGLKDRYWLKLATPLNNFNTIAVVYKEGATNNYDRNYDGALLIIGSDSFYSLSDNQKLAIQGRAYPLVDSDVVPLGAVFYQTGNHTISISKKEGVFDNGQNIYLKDKETGILTNLSQGSYTFTANKGESTGRFEIVYQSATLSTNTQQKDDLYVYRDGNNFVIKSEYKKITGLEVYDPSGRLVYATKSNSTEVILHSEKLNNGMYILKINRGEEVTSRKIIK